MTAPPERARDALLTHLILGSLVLWVLVYALLPLLVASEDVAPPPVLTAEQVALRQEQGFTPVALTYMPLNHRYREMQFLAVLPIEYRCLKQRGLSEPEIEARLSARYHIPKGFDVMLETARENRAEPPEYPFDGEEHCRLLAEQLPADEPVLPLPPPI